MSGDEREVNYVCDCKNEKDAHSLKSQLGIESGSQFSEVPKIFLSLS